MKSHQKESCGEPEFTMSPEACAAMVESVEGFADVRSDLLEFFGGNGLVPSEDDASRLTAIWVFLDALEAKLSSSIYMFTNPDLPPYEYTMVTSAEAALRMGKSKNHITHLCRKGEFKGAKEVMGRWLIPYGALVEVMHGHGRRKRKKDGRPKKSVE
jgi:hypothetical protein